MAAIQSSSRQQPFVTTSLWQAGLIAAVLSSTANAAIYGIARFMDTIPQTVMVETISGNGPITLGQVIAMSILPIVIATMLYAVVRRVTRQPARAFRIIGIIVLVASLALPFSITDVPLKKALTLDLMHVVTAMIALGILTRTSPAHVR